MDEKDYELLHALDETRNITHAADKLYMTQSALSKPPARWKRCAASWLPFGAKPAAPCEQVSR